MRLDNGNVQKQYVFYYSCFPFLFFTPDSFDIFSAEAQGAEMMDAAEREFAFRKSVVYNHGHFSMKNGACASLGSSTAAA